MNVSRRVEAVGLWAFGAALLVVHGCKNSNDLTGVTGTPATPTSGPTIIPSPASTPAATLTPAPTRTGLPTITPTPAASMDLSGNWIGTIRDLGNTDEFFCPGITDAIGFTVAQSGNSIHFSFTNGDRCSPGGVTNFDGTLSGNNLSGRIQKQVSACLLAGQARGPADPGHIQLDGLLEGSCDSVRVHIETTRD